MAVNRQERVQTLDNLLDGNRGGDPVTTNTAASQLADFYIETAGIGGDPLVGNSVLVANEAALRAGFRQILNTFGETQAEYATIPTRFQETFIQYWTGATLGIAIPPPPSTQIVTHVITVPGVVTPTIWDPVNDQRQFSERFVDLIITHFNTLQGLITALVPSPPGAPVPTPFPWTSYL